MNKPNSKLFWIGYYFGQNCILHPITGRWILVGFVDGDIYCKKNIGTIEEDCMSYPIEEIQLVLKFSNPWLIKSLSKLPFFYSWILAHAKDGYWVFIDQEFNQIIFEG